MPKEHTIRGIKFHRKRNGWMALIPHTHEVIGFVGSSLTLLVWRWFGIGPSWLVWHGQRLKRGDA